MSAIRAKYDAARKKALEKLRLERDQTMAYSKKPNANQQAVTIRWAVLEALAEMIDEADAALNMMEKEGKAREKEAYQMGKDEVQARWNASADQRQSPPELDDPQYYGVSTEGKRALREKEIKAKWPELFEPFTPKKD